VPPAKVDTTRYVLVEDTDFVRQDWARAAAESQVNLTMYSSPYDLIRELDRFDRETVFFLDYELGKNVNGVGLAWIVKLKLGAKVYLVTSHERARFGAELRDKVVDGVYGKFFIAGKDLSTYQEPRW